MGCEHSRTRRNCIEDSTALQCKHRHFKDACNAEVESGDRSRQWWVRVGENDDVTGTAPASLDRRRRSLAKASRGDSEGELPDFGIEGDRYVLNDARKTGVISQWGRAVAFGLSTRDSAFPRFAVRKSIAPYFGADLQEELRTISNFNEIPPARNSLSEKFTDTTSRC